MDAPALPIDLALRVLPQPDDATCGPTCLHAVYRFWGDDVVDLDSVVRDAARIPTGGTLAALLGLHALARGYSVRLYTANLRVFDPTWFDRTGIAHPDLHGHLGSMSKAAVEDRIGVAIAAYREFVARGGTIRMCDPTPRLIARHLERGEPIIAGLSSTWLYRAMRVSGPCDDDDPYGQPQGHFVVLRGYDPRSRLVQVADPTVPTPVLDGLGSSSEQTYAIGIERLISAILLGIVTDDADLLVLSPEVRS